MKNQLDYSEFIERYLDGEMGDNELIWFRKELDANPFLQKELNLRRKVNLAITDEKTILFKEQLDDVYYSLQKQKTVTLIRKPSPLVLGSVLAFLLIGTVLFNFIHNSKSNSKIFEKYYHPYESVITYRSSSINDDNDMKVAMQKYQDGDYKGALILFEKILKEDPTKTGLNFYSGISQMEDKNYDNAGTSFKKVISDGYNMYYEQAEWYLGLCYVITNRNDKAIPIFETIASGDGYFRKDAKKVLKMLR